MPLAPIALFTYARPHHTLRTLEALSKNRYAKQSQLYVFCDGPKTNSPEELALIQEVEDVVMSQKWCKEISVIQREKNIGLSLNITSGITEILQSYKKIIVLEDDIVTSQGFLQYMNDALDKYEHCDKVMHISGYMFPVKFANHQPQTHFYTAGSCWGWGTYSDRWALYENDPLVIRDFVLKHSAKEKFNMGGYANFYRQLSENINGQRHNWDIKWYGTMFMNQGLGLHPKVSLTQNIGNDSSGTNSPNTNYFRIPNLSQNCEVQDIPIAENPETLGLMRDYYYWQKPIKHHILKMVKTIST